MRELRTYYHGTFRQSLVENMILIAARFLAIGAGSFSEKPQFGPLLPPAMEVAREAHESKEREQNWDEQQERNREAAMASG